MFSKSLFKRTVKENWKLWLGITLGLCLMMVLLIGVASSSNISNRRGVSQDAEISQILTQFYGMFATMLPMIYIIIVGNRLIAAKIDNGSLATVMSKPIKRNQVSLTQAFFFIGSIMMMFLAVTVTGLIMIEATGIGIEIGGFLLLNLGIVMFHLAISGISYLASCIFNFSGKSLLAGAGIPILFFVFNILAQMGNLAMILGNFKYITLNTLFNVTDILGYSTNMIWQFGILLAVAVITYIFGVLTFKKKDLPL